MHRPNKAHDPAKSTLELLKHDEGLSPVTSARLDDAVNELHRMDAHDERLVKLARQFRGVQRPTAEHRDLVQRLRDRTLPEIARTVLACELYNRSNERIIGLSLAGRAVTCGSTGIGPSLLPATVRAPITNKRPPFMHKTRIYIIRTL